MERFTLTEAAKINQLTKKFEKVIYNCLNVAWNNDNQKEICEKMEELIDSGKKIRPYMIKYDLEDFWIKLKRIESLMLSEDQPNFDNIVEDYNRQLTEIITLPHFQCIVNKFKFETDMGIELKKRLKGEEKDLKQELKILKTKLCSLKPKLQLYFNLVY